MIGLPPSAVAAVLALGGLSAAAWGTIVWRMVERKSVIPFARRRPVPWGAVHLGLVLVLMLAVQVAVKVADRRFSVVGSILALPEGSVGPGEAAPAARGSWPEDPAELEAQHPLVVLLYQSRNPRTLIFCLLVAVVIAPLAEEFLFRLLLQGWLECWESRLRRRIPPLRRVIRGAIPIVPVSVFFAGLHFRGPTEMDPQALGSMLGRVGLGSVITILIATAWIRLATRATLADFGVVPGKVVADAGLGLFVFLAAAAPIYFLQIVLKTRFPSGRFVDPITLFFFALVLGTLYYRTHRIVPAMVAHMALNGFSLLVAWLAMAGNA